MKKAQKRRKNPEYEYNYFIFRPITTAGGDEDIEVLSSAETEDGETVYSFARDFDRMFSELNFSSEIDALNFLRKMKAKKVVDYKSRFSRGERHIVSPSIATDLYLNINYSKHYQAEVSEVLGGEEVDGSEYSDYIKFVAYIGYSKIHF